MSRIRRTNPMHKILLAEDDNDMRRFLVKALENAGFQVSPHDNGMSAYQRLREEPFEMLLTDIVMPVMDGIELARRASELDPDIKIMFITGFAAVARNSDSRAPTGDRSFLWGFWRYRCALSVSGDPCGRSGRFFASRRCIQKFRSPRQGFDGHCGSATGNFGSLGGQKRVVSSPART